MPELATRLLSLSLLALGACAAPVDTGVVPASPDWPSLDLASWSIPENLTPGFVGSDREPAFLTPFEAGDLLLFAIELEDAEKRERWFLELEVTQGLATDREEIDGELSFDLPSIKVKHTFTWEDQVVEVQLSAHLYEAQIRLFDERGGSLGDSEIRIPHFIAEGLVEGIESLDELEEKDEREGYRFTREDILPYVKAVNAIHSVFLIVDSDELLRPILMRAASPPSLLSMVTNLGVSVVATADLHQSATITVPPPYLLPRSSFHSIPMQISANGEVSLDLQILVTDPASPLLPCGGMVGIVGQSPERDDLRLEVALIGARCAPEEDG